MVPLLIGWVIDRYSTIRTPDGTVSYDYTLPMCIFALFGFVAILIAWGLKREDSVKGYGLEQRNMK